MERGRDAGAVIADESCFSSARRLVGVTFLAAALGIILIFWRYILRFIKRILGIKEKPKAAEEEITPYVEPEDDDGLAK